MSILAQALREIVRTEEAAQKLLDTEKEQPRTNGHDGSADTSWPVPDSNWPAKLAKPAFHGLAGDIVQTLGPHTEADEAAILLQFLAFAGICMGRNQYYLVEGDRHYSNIFIAMVGESSKARKGTSLGRIRQLFAMIDDPFSDRCIQSGLSSGEGLIWAVRDETDDDPGVIDKRLLVAESELAGLLRVMQRDGNIISRIVRDAWDRGDLGVLTKKFSTRASNAHISIVGHITVDELTRYLDRTEAANGFANRFLFIAVKRSKLLPHGGNLSDSDLRPLAKRLAEVISYTQLVRQIRMQDSTARLWEKVYPELSEGQPGLYGAVTGRAEAQVIRLALLYALLDKDAEISVEHLKAGLAIWDYADASARFIFGDATGDPVKDTILTSLRNNPDGLSRTEISRLFQGHQKSDRINRTLEDLRRLGRVKQGSIDTDGRPTEVWQYK